MRLRRTTQTAVGVDIGRRTIKAAQLALVGGTHHIQALSLVPRPEAEREVCAADAMALREILRRQGFRGNRIVVAAPETALLPATMELPAKLGGAPAEQIIRMELSRLHSIPPHSFEMAYWDLKAANPSRPVTHALAVACPHAAANAFLDIFEGAGFHVAALDVRSVAAARACGPLILPPPGITAIVDLGWQATTLLFVCGRSLVYERSLDSASMADLAARLAEAFNIPLESAAQILRTVGTGGKEPADQFDDESLEAIGKHLRTHFDRLLDGLKVPLSYVKHQFPGEGVQRMLLIGGGAAVGSYIASGSALPAATPELFPDLEGYLEVRLGMEVRRADPASLFGSPTGLPAKARNPTLTVAVGLAQFGSPHVEHRVCGAREVPDA